MRRPGGGGPAVWRHVLAAQERERQQITAELLAVRGLMPLLMKRRNGGAWTRDEQQELRKQMRAMAHLSPYLFVLLLPGSFALIPALAWWLDRRRVRREDDASAVVPD